MKISNLARSAACDAIVDLLDAGSPPGSLEIRTGAAPTNTTDADSGTLLATFVLGNPAFGSASSGVATANAISNVTIAANGTAAHFRAKNAAGVTILQGTVGVSGADINFDSVNFVSGAEASISSWTVTHPA